MENLLSERADIVLAHDMSSLPLALQLKSEFGAKLVFDAHEYYPLEFEDSPEWVAGEQQYIEYLCGRFLRHVDLMYTVSSGLAQKYEDVFGIRGIKVITNAPAHRVLDPRPVDPDHIKMLHHGMAIKGRGLVENIEMMRHLDDRYSLDLMLVPSPGDMGFIEYLKDLASSDSRIRFIDPVPFDQIVPLVNGYDLMIISIPPVSFNNRHFLPNKFFESVQARVGLVIGPSVEMVGIVREHRIGIVSEGFDADSLAKAVKGLSPDDIFDLKRNCDGCALELSAESNMRTLIDDLIATLKD